MTAIAQSKHYSHAAYFELLEHADHRYEYDDGEIFMMAGGTYYHSLIAANVGAVLHQKLNGTPCRTLQSDLNVHIEASNSFVFPDLSVICGPPEFFKDRRDIITNPTVIVEVLSESTEAYDRGGKFRRYQTLSSLRDYVLISQDEPEIEVFSRQENGSWLYRAYAQDASGIITATLSSLNVELDVATVFSGIDFEAIRKDKEQRAQAKRDAAAE